MRREEFECHSSCGATHRFVAVPAGLLNPLALIDLTRFPNLLGFNKPAALDIQGVAAAKRAILAYGGMGPATPPFPSHTHPPFPTPAVLLANTMVKHKGFFPCLYWFVGQKV